MKRTSAVLVSLLIWIAMACTTSAPASTTTTTTTLAPVSDPGSPTTIEPTTLGGSEGFLTRAPGTLIVGTERLTAPWYTEASPGGVVTGGFEYDLAKELGRRLGVPKLKVVTTSLVLLMTAQDCKCDIMLSGVTVTDGRARTIDLSEPYLTADQGVLVRAGTSISSVADASALRWGVALHNLTGQDVITKRIKPTAPPHIVVNDDDAIRLVVDGRLDAVMLDTPDALAVTLADPRLAVAGQFRTGELIAVALSLGSPNTALINDVIRDMRNDGTIDRLLRAYLGIEPANVPPIPP